MLNFKLWGHLHKDIQENLKEEIGVRLLLYYKYRVESEFTFHISVPLEEDERNWFFLMVKEKMLRQADIIIYSFEQMDVPYSSWLPLPEEVDYHHVSNQKIFQLVRIRYYLQYAQWKDQTHQTHSVYHNY